jgi:hypothetical protein
MADIVSDGMTTYTALNSPSKTSVVNSRDAKLHYLFNKVAKNGGEQAHQDLKDELEHRMYVDRLFEQTFPKHFGKDALSDFNLTVQPSDYNCLRFLMSTVETNCGKFSDYSLKYVKHLVHVCENQDEQGIMQAAQKVANFCTQNADELAYIQ